MPRKLNRQIRSRRPLTLSDAPGAACRSGVWQINEGIPRWIWCGDRIWGGDVGELASQMPPLSPSRTYSLPFFFFFWFCLFVPFVLSESGGLEGTLIQLATLDVGFSIPTRLTPAASSCSPRKTNRWIRSCSRARTGAKNRGAGERTGNAATDVRETVSALLYLPSCT